MAIGKFFENTRKQPSFKNTIFVLTSDHTNLIRTYGYHAVIIDTLTTTVGDVDLDKAVELQTQVLRPLRELAQVYDCAVIIVHGQVCLALPARAVTTTATGPEAARALKAARTVSRWLVLVEDGRMSEIGRAHV